MGESETDNVNLKSQAGTSSFEGNYGSIMKLPFVFTEQGVATLATVLRTSVAAEVSIKSLLNVLEHKI